MARLEDEFRHILIRNIVPLDPEGLRQSPLNFPGTAIAFQFFCDDVIENIQDVNCRSHHSRGRGISFYGDDMSSIDLIHPKAVIDLREIADQMIRSGYEKECCQAYCSVRRDVLDKRLVILGVEKLSIGEVKMMEWRSLDDKIRRWIRAFRLVVWGLLCDEKRLCDRIFSGSDSIKEVCFLETSRRCVMQFLNFGEAVAIGRSAENLFPILDMYQALSGVIPDLQALFMDGDAGDMMCIEAKEVLDALGEAVIGNFVEFENAVQGEASRKSMQKNGETHPFTRYVMHYARLLADYGDTLNSLLETSEDNWGQLEKENNDNLETTSMSLIAKRLLALITCLESNIEEKSRMYADGAMQYIFLMNNILHIVQEVKASKLRNILGNNWIKKQQGLIDQHATHYLRAAWSKVLSCLTGISWSSHSTAKVALKERFKTFNTCFEDIYRIQTAWKIPDPQLREELRINISIKVIPAYRSFLRRYGTLLEGERRAGKYIQYSPEDLENYLLDLFEGTPLILHHITRKNT